MKIKHIMTGVSVTFDYFPPIKGGGFKTNKEIFPRVGVIERHRPEHKLTLVKTDKGFRSVKWSGVTNLHILDND